MRRSLRQSRAAGLRTKIERDPAHPDHVLTVHGEGYRFVVLLRSQEGDLGADLADTDPQILGVAPLEARARSAGSEATAGHVNRLIAHLRTVLEGEPAANSFLLRGFSRRPTLPTFSDLYGLRAGAFAGYPLYRGVASVCGMEVVPCGKSFAEILDTVTERWDDFDFLFRDLFNYLDRLFFHDLVIVDV